jgi:predicted HAD superfamily Cof-like phosphohydrolase
MSGPIDNLYMCYGMMELAKDVLRERHKANQQKIQKVGPQELLEFGGKRS